MLVFATTLVVTLFSSLGEHWRELGRRFTTYLNVPILIPRVVAANPGAPSEYALLDAYPNPFNATSNIRFRVAQSTFVSINVNDVLGREVQTLMRGDRGPGEHLVQWNASGQSSGVYFMRMTAGQYSFVTKANLVK